MTVSPILPRLRVRQIPVARLTPYARNARKHPKKQIERIAAAMQEFGFLIPVLVDAEQGIIAGHGRVLAAERLGLAKVPAIQVDHLSETQKRAFILADNKLAESSSWDEKLLGLEIGELKLQNFDLGIAGFSPSELKRWSQGAGAGEGEGEIEDDGEAPAAPERPVTRPGDLWLLGDHRVLCGDATSPNQVHGLLAGGAAPSLMVTDPPYGVDYDPAWRERAAPGPRSTGEVAHDHAGDWRAAWKLFPGAVAYVWCADLHLDSVADSLRRTEFDLRAQIIWVKHNLVMGRGHYHWQHESCWYAVRRGKTAKWQGDRKQSTVWKFGSRGSPNSAKGVEDIKTPHATQKPLEAMARPMRHHTQEGETVYDPFLGSGTSVIAAEKLGRVCYGLEILPAHVDVIVARWQNLTGKAAVLDGDGRSFAEIAAARADESEAA